MNLKYFTFFFLLGFSFDIKAMYKGSDEPPIFSIEKASPKLSKASSTDSFFDKKTNTVWMFKNRDSFLRASETLIDEAGQWKGKEECPKVIKYFCSISDHKEDINIIEQKWLPLKSLQYFSFEDEKIEDYKNYKVIRCLYETKKNTENFQNIYKLIWLGRNRTLNHYNLLGLHEFPPEQWVKNHMDYYSNQGE